jgi:hypothetical protein
MPRPDPPTGRQGRISVSVSLAAVPSGAARRGLPKKKRPRRNGNEPEREPVAPDKPRPLSDGAAAALEFDD